MTNYPTERGWLVLLVFSFIAGFLIGFLALR